MVVQARLRIKLLLLVWLSPSAALADTPRWVNDPQTAADEGEVAFVGEGRSKTSSEAAKSAAVEAVHAAVRERVQNIAAAAAPKLATAAKQAECTISADRLRERAAALALTKFADLPIEKWFGAQTEEDNKVEFTSWVFVQFSATELARVVLEAAAAATECKDDSQRGALKSPYRDAVAPHAPALPPS